MIRKIFLLHLLLFFITGKLQAQQPTVIVWEELEKILKTRNDTLYVVNFWATWCKPCVAELPVFIQAEDTYINQKVRFIYVSLDFKRDFQNRLVPFAEKQLARRTVYLLDAPDYNAWIDKVSPSWQGAIPATFMFRGNPKYQFFLEGEFHDTQLIDHLKPLLYHE